MQKDTLWSGLALFATLTTSAWVTRQMRARRKGQHPSDQLPEPLATEGLRARMNDAAPLLHRLMQAPTRAAALAEHEESLLLHQAELLLTLQALHRQVHEIHQHLLSLYPEVSAESIEAIRQHAWEISRLLEAPTLPEETTVARLAEELLLTLRTLRESL